VTKAAVCILHYFISFSLQISQQNKWQNNNNDLTENIIIKSCVCSPAYYTDKRSLGVETKLDDPTTAYSTSICATFLTKASYK